MSPTLYAKGALLDIGHQLSTYSTVTLLSAAVGASILFVVGQLVYNIWFHPLSTYPGPKLASASRIYYCYYLIKGEWPFVVRRLHEKYGNVVRVAPDELSYASAEAFNALLGFRSGKTELQKDPIHYSSIGSGQGGIIRADRERHAHIRKQVSHGFSERALRDEEVVIRHYADSLIERLKEHSKNGTQALNIVAWLNFLTFDVISDLVFGESFGCLEASSYHPWVALIFDSIKFSPWAKAGAYYPILGPIARWILPRDLKRRRRDHIAMARAKSEGRKLKIDDRIDLTTGLLLPDSGVTDLEYTSTAQSFIVAGSETTATLMSGATYYLLTNPEVMKKAVSEIRTTFSSPDDISFLAVNKLEYLLACLNESLRIYPPVPDAFPRHTGNEPQLVLGKLVPPHTTIGISQFSTFRDPKNFARPDEFIPERWLPNSPFNDNKAALQPFHVGPRNCIGKNLAYFEMRMAMTLLLWHFDLELEESSKNWADQKIFLFWDKPEMMVKLHPRKM